MAVWQKIYQVITDRIGEDDRAFELAYLRFGEARRWLVEQANLSPRGLVLEIGYGQGYLTMELASVLRTGKVVGIDLLHERVTSGVTRWIANQIGIRKRIALLACDSTRLPFRDGSFDTVVSFLALQDIRNTKNNGGVLATVNEACRVAKRSASVAIADDSFPSCKPEGEQGRLFDGMKRYWHNLLPSSEQIVETMRKSGISQVKVLSYDPKESLLPKDAERELRLSVESMKAFKVEVDFENFWKHVGKVVEKQGRIFPCIILLLGTKA
jgi:ubiquinone/menaquinone biosynthesis C-methylase UbiE